MAVMSSAGSDTRTKAKAERETLPAAAAMRAAAEQEKQETKQKPKQPQPQMRPPQPQMRHPQPQQKAKKKAEGDIFESAVVDRKVNNFLKIIKTGVKSSVESAVKVGKIFSVLTMIKGENKIMHVKDFIMFVIP
jgi:hypothetical protein